MVRSSANLNLEEFRKFLVNIFKHFHIFDCHNFSFIKNQNKLKIFMLEFRLRIKTACAKKILKRNVNKIIEESNFIDKKIKRTKIT